MPTRLPERGSVRRARRDASRGRLWVVASPIGNLQDVTLRALEALRAADLVVAEDTRRARVLLERHGVAVPLSSLPAFDERRRIPSLVARLRDGARVALLSDAGMPGLSDPGGRLVAAARAEGVTVEVLPGPSAVTTAVVASGLPILPFRFLGFLPRKGARRRRLLRAMAEDPGASVFFEAPGRLGATLVELAGVLPEERRLAVCRELTKRFEEVVVGTASELSARFAEGTRGEVTVVLEAVGDPFARTSDRDAANASGVREGVEAHEEAVRDAMERVASGTPLREASRSLAHRLACSRREAYQRLLRARARWEQEGEGGRPGGVEGPETRE